MKKSDGKAEAAEMTAGIDAVWDFLNKHPVLYAATRGLDKLPSLHPVRLCFIREGAIYFACAKCESFYGELSLSPNFALCAADEKSGRVLTLRGRAVFTEDAEIIEECAKSDPALDKKWGGDRAMLIAFFLTDGTAEFTSMSSSERRMIPLGAPENALIGIKIKKNTELRDRLIKLMERREAEKPETGDEAALFSQKLYDGALMYFAETAKALWPRMDIRPIERSALFETYDERESFTLLAKKLIGNANIDKVEDITHYINKQTLAELNKTASDTGE